MKFTNQYIAFICLSVIVSVSAVILGGAFTFRELALKHQEIKVGAVIEVVDKQLSANNGRPEFAAWLPNLLRAQAIVKMEVANDNGTIYRFHTLADDELSPQLSHYKFYLQSHPGFFVKVAVDPPFKHLTFDLRSLSGLVIGLILVVVALSVSLRWLKKQLKGAEKLERRAQFILNGQVKKYAHRDNNEWPLSAAKAIDELIEQLADAKQERSRFDTYIRANAFVDEKTSLANRLAFENRLDVSLRDESVTTGAVMLVDLAGLEEVNHTLGTVQGDEILNQVATIVKNFGLKFNGSFFARYAGAQFAILFPQVSLKETKDIANQICKVIDKVHLPESIDIDDFYYVGVTNFIMGDQAASVIDDADKAARAARLEGASGWYMFDQENTTPDVAKGSIRWRSLLRHTLDHNGLILFLQPVFSAIDGRECGHEVVTRIRDEKSKLVNAGEFQPMAEKVGMTLEIDRAMTEKALGLLRQRGELSSPMSLNLCASSICNKEFRLWLRYELMQLPKLLLNKLMIELPEEHVSRYQQDLLPALQAIKMLGCKLAVDHAGQDVISMQYIKECEIDVLKLHPSLVREIEQRQVNQIAIRSLMGACADSQVQVIAVGVENAAEWDYLKRLGVHAGQGYFFSPPKEVLS